MTFHGSFPCEFTVSIIGKLNFCFFFFKYGKSEAITPNVTYYEIELYSNS